jgi:hypothetical protein
VELIDPLSRRRAVMALASAGLLSVPALARAQLKGAVINAPTASAPSQGATETIETLDDPFSRMTAPVFVNGDGPHFFMVDTGANRSVISAELAAKLNLPLGAEAPLHGVAGMKPAPSTVANELRLGERTERNVELAVLPVADLGVPGVAGVDRFGNRRLQLNFRERRLVLDAKYQTSPPFTVTVPARKRAGQLMIVDADLAGIKLQAFLDTGAQRTIGNPALHQLAILRGRGSRFSDVRIESVTGQVLGGQIAVLPELRLGQLRMSNIAMTFANLHVFNIWGLHGPAVMIGVDALSSFDTVTLDFQRSQVRFQLYPDQIRMKLRTNSSQSRSRIPTDR